MRANTPILKVKHCNFYTLPMDFFESTLTTANRLETIVDNRLILDDGQEGAEFYARSVNMLYLDVFISSREIKDDRLLLLGKDDIMGYRYKVLEDKE